MLLLASALDVRARLQSIIPAAKHQQSRAQNGLDADAHEHNAARCLTKERLAREAESAACTHDWLHHFATFCKDPSQYHPDLPSEYHKLLNEGDTDNDPGVQPRGF